MSTSTVAVFAFLPQTCYYSDQFSSVQSLSHVWLFTTPWTTARQASLSITNSSRPHGPQHARPPCPSPTATVYPNSSPLSRWCHPNISSSVVPFSSCPQSFPASGSFPMIQFFASSGQSIGVSASTSVLPMVAALQFQTILMSQILVNWITEEDSPSTSICLLEETNKLIHSPWLRDESKESIPSRQGMCLLCNSCLFVL